MWFRQTVSRLATVAGIAHGSRAFGGPLQLNLSLTNRCNIRCIHCYFYSPLLDMPNMRTLRRDRQTGREVDRRAEIEKAQRIHVDPDRAASVIGEALAMGVCRFQFSGNGECFLHPQALELMGCACLGGAYCIGNTNGTLLDRDTVDALIRMRFGELRVTVMGGTKEVYNRTHPGVRAAMFEQVRDNLMYIRERKTALAVSRPGMKVVCIVIDQNCDGLVDFAKLAVEVGADAVLYRPVDDLGDPGMALLVPTAANAALARRQLAEARLLLDARGVSHNIDAFLSVFQSHLDTRQLYRVIPCYYGWLAGMVEPDGHVFPCCRCYEPLGNVYETSFAAVWYSDHYRKFRYEAGRLHRGGRPEQGCECDRCVHHEANLAAFRALHPLRGRTRQ